MKTSPRTLLPLALLSLMAAGPAQAEVAGIFSQGRTHFVVSGGTGYGFDQSYFVLGVGASYYLVDGLNLGLHVESWSGGDPGITKVTPSLQYVLHQIPTVKPYAGVFFRRSYIDGLPDLDSTGARAGIYVAAGRNAFLGAGVVYESYQDCNTSRYVSCSETYPEISFTIAF